MNGPQFLDRLDAIATHGIAGQDLVQELVDLGVVVSPDTLHVHRLGLPEGCLCCRTFRAGCGEVYRLHGMNEHGGFTPRARTWYSASLFFHDTLCMCARDHVLFLYTSV